MEQHQQQQQQQPAPTTQPTPPADPWVVQQPKQTEQVPVGSYVGKFTGVTGLSLKDGALKWRWAWSITTGPQAGKEASALTDRSISPTTLPGTIVAGLLGRQLQAGENVKTLIDGCIGKSYMVGVQPGPKGGKPQVRMVMTEPTM